MKTRVALSMVVIALALTPVVLSIGALVLIPLAIALIPVVLFAAVLALPTLIMIGARGSEPRAIADSTIAAPATLA